MYKIVYTRQASRSFKKLPRPIALQIRRKITEIAADPFAYHASITKLKNRSGYRLRVGDWRVIYDVQKEQVILMVLKIAGRGEIYR